MKRAQERREQSLRAEEEREKAEKAKSGNQRAAKPAVMDVDVQMTLTKLDYKTFAEAKPNAATRLADGDPLWLYVKFNGNLGRYVYALHDTNGSERYVLFVEYGPQGDVTAKGHYLLEFRKDELALTEMKMSLSPGRAGHNRALPIFIRKIALSKPGLWNNELRITNVPALPRGPNDYLAKVSVVCDFTKGIAKYPKMIGEFQSMILRDSTDMSKLPIVGKFVNPEINGQIMEKLKADGITPTRLYFVGDNWAEYSDIPFSIRQIRAVTGAFTYQKGKNCLYGTADVTQNYDAANDRFDEATISIRKDIATPCTP